MQPPFSKALESNGFIFLSGEVPIDKEGKIPEGIEAQTALVMNKIKTTLLQYNAEIENILSVTVYLTDKSDFDKFNHIYENYFSLPYPVRTTVICELVVDVKLEITVIAQKK
ncbi:RidA family protein [Acinetobacter lactucae]|uniref:RidA family protein n=1 Tax=Acinetobacter lactucae TaxID=1785128 RepID=UPI00077E23A8|nr:RidA family protein [Acinetobacter lactucae]